MLCFETFGLALQPVLHDLPIERAAADFEDQAACFLFQLHALEHADDVGALGLGERGQALAGGFDRGFGGVQELDVAAAGSPAGDDSAARETVLSSSRMLPGQ